ncbi:hypothetical protein Tco_1357340 [Tanacetum coccineum]
MTTMAENVIAARTDNRPSMLEKSMYNSWKSRMKLYIRGLPPDVYNLVNYHSFAKEIWDRVKLLMEGTKLSLQERECKLYNKFDMFTSEKGEMIHAYYLKFAQLINDMNTIGMAM